MVDKIKTALRLQRLRSQIFSLQLTALSTGWQTRTKSRAAALGVKLAVWWRGVSEPVSVFVGWRLALAGLAFAAVLLMPSFGTHNGVAPDATRDLNFWQERLLGVWTYWDGEWFLRIAQVGYLPNEPTSAFFPLYPMLVRLVSFLTGGNYVVAGVLVGAGAALTAFVLLYQLVAHDFSKQVAGQTLLYLAAFPTAFFLTACYSEGLFLALSLGAFIAARRYSNWWLAGILVGLAALTRNIGILLLLPVGWEWWRQRTPGLLRPSFKTAGAWWQRQRLAITGLLLCCITAGAFLVSWLLYQAMVLGNPFSFVAQQSRWMWDRGSAWPWETLARSVWLLSDGRGESPSWPASFRENHNLLDLGFWVFMAGVFIVAVYQSWRKQLPLSYLVWFAVALIIPLFSPSPEQPLMSFPRFAILAFPAFVVLARLGLRWRTLHYAYLISGLLLLALLFSRFANWYWVA